MMAFIFCTDLYYLVKIYRNEKRFAYMKLVKALAALLCLVIIIYYNYTT